MEINSQTIGADMRQSLVQIMASRRSQAIMISILENKSKFLSLNGGHLILASMCYGTVYVTVAIFIKKCICK